MKANKILLLQNRAFFLLFKSNIKPFMQQKYRVSLLCLGILSLNVTLILFTVVVPFSTSAYTKNDKTEMFKLIFVALFVEQEVFYCVIFLVKNNKSNIIYNIIKTS